MTIDLARLTKLLNLTRSENDNEALSAIRLANKMIGNWAGVLGQPTEPLKRPAPPTQSQQDESNRRWEARKQNFWNEVRNAAQQQKHRRGILDLDLSIVKYCLENCDIKHVRFLEELRIQLERGIELSDNQRQGLCKIREATNWREA